MKNDMQKSDNKKDDIAIKVENVSKTFRIPHEKHTSLKSAALNIYKKKSFTKFEAVKDVSFEVKKGEFLGVIGRNGSGKSTLLKMLAGIYVPDSGKITINGKLSPFLELGVGFNPELSARENVYLGGAVLGLSKKEIDSKFDEIIKFAELEEFVDMKFKNFSSGMQVRLAFALSINARAEVLLMDEVLAVGDSNFQSKCLDKFLELKENKSTIVLVSHGMDSVERYCDRVIYLEKGIVKNSGKSMKIVNQYNEDNIAYQEEKADLEQEDKKNDEKNEEVCGDKELGRIKKVEFLDKNQNKKKIFVSGEDLNIRVFFEIYKKIESPKIGLAIAKEFSSIVYGTNSEKQGIKLGTVDCINGYMNFKIEKLPLLEGSYQIITAITDKNQKLIDQISHKFSFKVNNGKIRDYGMINLSPEVTLFRNEE